MNLFKIMCFCVIGTAAFSMEETMNAASNQKDITSTAVTVWVGIPQADTIISKGADKFNTLMKQNPQLQAFATKIAPYLATLHTVTDNADQRFLLGYVAGSVISQNTYLYPITLPLSAYLVERTLKSIADAWRISGEEKKSIITINELSFDARELFVTAGAIAMLWERDIYSATFLGGAYALAYLTRDNKEKLFDAGSFLAYVILLNALYSLDL